MKAVRTSSTFAVSLTWAEWDILDALEKAHDNEDKPYKYYPETWEFPMKDKIDDYEWNGHFGLNIFFRAEPGAEKHFVKFLKSLLDAKRYPVYLKGLSLGESGADEPETEEGTSFLDEQLMSSGWRTGKRIGKLKALTLRQS